MLLSLRAHSREGARAGHPVGSESEDTRHGEHVDQLGQGVERSRDRDRHGARSPQHLAVDALHRHLDATATAVASRRRARCTRRGARALDASRLQPRSILGRHAALAPLVRQRAEARRRRYRRTPRPNIARPASKVARRVSDYGRESAALERLVDLLTDRLAWYNRVRRSRTQHRDRQRLLFRRR